MEDQREITGPETIRGPDGVTWRWEQNEVPIDVEVSGGLLATEPATLPWRTSEALESKGHHRSW